MVRSLCQAPRQLPNLHVVAEKRSAAPYPEAPADCGEVTAGLGHAGEPGDGHRALRSRLPHRRPLRS